MRETDGNLMRAAAALGVPYRTLSRWVAGDDELGVELQRVRDKAGFEPANALGKRAAARRRRLAAKAAAS